MRMVRIFIVTLLLAGCSGKVQKGNTNIEASTETLKKHVEFFNALDEEDVVNLTPNDQAFTWLAENIPLFECPDSILEQTYYYRWWTFRKHLKSTPDGYIWTEFITPVGHAGKYNSISCALGHHIYEGRWLRDPEYLNQYINFWFLKEKNFENSKFHKFSSWAADAIYNKFKTDGDTAFALSLLDELVKDYQEWTAEKQLENGMYWQFDVRDGMEESISGSRIHKNPRPTINSYMYGNAIAIAKLAEMEGNAKLSEEYYEKAGVLRNLVHENLWDEEAAFFKAFTEGAKISGAREAIGFIPWYFNLPEDADEYGAAWEQIRDPKGFNAPWGLTTAEIRHPEFMANVRGGCEWDGAIWPFASTQTLKGLSNLLNNYQNHNMKTQDFYSALHRYAESHQKNGQPYLGEYQHPMTGYWLKGDSPRSRYYNHSGFTDLVISDLVGVKPGEGNTLEINPLIPENTWDWFILDKVPYHGRSLTIVWDKSGEKYKTGKGFRVFADGKQIARSGKLERITATL